MRAAMLCFVLGFVPAVIVAGIALLYGRPFQWPSIAIVLLCQIPVWGILRTYADRTTKDKVFAVKVTTDTIAHEMRTPMLSIEMSCDSMRRAFNRFMTKSVPAEQHENPYVQSSARTIYQAIDRIEGEANRMQSNLNLLLQNASSPKSIPPDTRIVLSIAEIVNGTVTAYPFYSGTDLENIEPRVVSDFPTWISPALFDHVITNLLKIRYTRFKKQVREKLQ
jgi:signal transduction histidine kinase